MKKLKKKFKKKSSLNELSNFVNFRFKKTYFVPDSVFKLLIKKIKSKMICARENHAVAMAFGGKLIDKKCLIMMQNSGLGLSIDSLIGTFDLYNEGCVIFLSNRGKLDWEEVQHKKWGVVTRPIIKSLNFKFYNFNNEGMLAVKKAYKYAFSKNKIVIVLFERGNIDE